jgi:hypothetical protein
MVVMKMVVADVMPPATQAPGRRLAVITMTLAFAPDRRRWTA